MKNYYLVGGVTVVLLGFSASGWYINRLSKENVDLKKQYSLVEMKAKEDSTKALEIAKEEKTKLQQEYEKRLKGYQQEFDTLQKRVKETDMQLEATRQTHMADKAKVTELEKKVQDALAQVEQYKKKRDEEKISPSLTDIAYERVDTQYTSLSFVMHRLTPEHVTVLEATLDRALRKLNKKRTDHLLIYSIPLTDPEFISHGPWVKAEIWEEENGYAIKIISSLPDNKELRLLEILEKNCGTLPFSKLRNSLK